MLYGKDRNFDLSRGKRGQRSSPGSCFCAFHQFHNRDLWVTVRMLIPCYMGEKKASMSQQVKFQWLPGCLVDYGHDPGSLMICLRDGLFEM